MGSQQKQKISKTQLGSDLNEYKQYEESLFVVCLCLSAPMT